MHAHEMISERGAIEHASQLPLIDAAYYLWRLRYETRPKNTPERGPSSPEGIRQAMQEARDRVQQDYDNAETGETSQKLRAAHPRCNDDGVRRAMRAAVMLDLAAIENCRRRAPSSAKNFAEFVAECEKMFKDGLEKTRIMHPGFQPSTYNDLEREVRWALR